MKKFFKNKNINIIKILKIAIGSSIAIFIADILGLKYSASAGIITLLSIQDTKKETLIVAGRRFFAFLFALSIAYILFQSFGYYTPVFGVFLLVFIAGSFILKLQDGISMCSVLITHFLIEKNMEVTFIGNEVILFLTGTIIGIVSNLYIPGNTVEVKADMRLIEEDIKVILRKFEVSILPHKNGIMKEMPEETKEHYDMDKDLADMDQHLKEALTRAYNNLNNTLLTDTRYYIQYFTMRRNQHHILVHMKEQLGLLTIVPVQAQPIAIFIKHITEQLHEYNNAEKLLEELIRIKIKFKEEPNPKSRDEFENRAVLYLILYDLEEFLNLKRNFVLNITSKQIETFWKD